MSDEEKTNLFNFERYAIPVISGSAGAQLTSYVDGTDALANKGMSIGFHHIISSKSVYFKAFITAFNETYTSDWASETVYGRADPIYMFKNTQRKITLAFKIPAGSAGEAYENLAKAQALLQFLYPMYTDINNANTISQSPLVRLKIMNLVQQANKTATALSSAEMYDEYKSSADATFGLLGVINNLTVNHNLDNPDHGVIEKTISQNGTSDATILPKLIEINLDFSPIHEHTVGWHEKDLDEAIFGKGATTLQFADLGFPYGAEQAITDTSMGLDGVTAANWSEDITSDTAFLSEAQQAAEATAEEAAEAQAARDAAAARYSGLFGESRYKKDVEAIGAGTATDYQTEAVAGHMMAEMEAAEKYDPEQ